jgi:hypothetical protein
VGRSVVGGVEWTGCAVCGMCVWRGGVSGEGSLGRPVPVFVGQNLWGVGLVGVGG